MGDASLIAIFLPAFSWNSAVEVETPGKTSSPNTPKTDEKGPEYTSVFWAFEEGESAGKPGSVPLAR